MDLRQLQYFLAVASTRNVSRAASVVWVSQPALTRQMRLLEEELGVKLFERSARGMTLTPTGELLQQRALAVMRSVGAMKDEIGAYSPAVAGTVGLGTPSALRTMLTARVATRFALSYPEALLRIREGTSMAIRSSLTNGDIEVAVFSSEEPQRPLRCQPLLSESLVAVAVPAAGLRMTRPLTVRELCKQPLILTAYPNSLRQIVDRAAQRLGAEIKVRMEVDMTALMLDLVRHGLGYAVLPYCAVHEHLGAGALSAAPVRGLNIHWLLACSSERPLTAAGRALVDTVRQECAALMESGQWPTAGSPGPSGRLRYKGIS